MADRPDRRRLLILGGTGAARSLAAQAAALDGLNVTTSLAGRTNCPTAPEGELRIGGFGGAAGLASWLREDRTDAVIDATHPFAAGISRNAAAACDELGLPRLVLHRPPWRAEADDKWVEVDTPAQAAEAVCGSAERVFLTLGAGALAAFDRLPGIWFLVRTVDAPATPPPLVDHHLITGRGPFTLDGETRLMQAYKIDCVVSRNSGGDATYAKIAAARNLGLPVVMLRRPAPPGGETVATVDAVLAWLRNRFY